MSDLKDLEPLSKRLNAATDELNQALQTIQHKLNAQALGIEVWLDGQYDESLAETDWEEIVDQYERPTGERQFSLQELGYGRLGDGWALLVRTRRFVIGRDTDGEETRHEYEDNRLDRKTLVRAARSLRITAVTLIPTLIDRLKAVATEAIERVEQPKKIAGFSEVVLTPSPGSVHSVEGQEKLGEAGVPRDELGFKLPQNGIPANGAMNPHCRVRRRLTAD